MEPTQTSSFALDYEKGCKADVDAARKMLQGLEQPREAFTTQNVLDPLNDLLILVDRADGLASLYRNVHPDPAVTPVAERCEQEISKISTDIGLSRPLFDAVSGLDVSGEEDVTRHWVKRLLRDFRRAGVDKDPDTREKIKALREELVSIGQEFSRNIRADVRSIQLDSKEELAGLPDDYIQAHPPGQDGRITITTDSPDYIPFMTYAVSDARRLELYKVYRNRGWPQNELVLVKMLAKRHELAQALGFTSWADYITEDKMIKTARAARKFIDRISDIAAARSREDYRELLARLQKDEAGAREVGDWQKEYIEELVKRDSFGFDSQALRPYFPYERVKAGVLDISGRLFGLTYRKADARVWHPSVEAYDVLSDGEVIGRFFLDMHPRPNKYKHAAMFPMRSGVQGKQTPEVALVCNFPGGGADPGLMEHEQVTTFFHEFGHLLHHLLGGGQRWVALSGIATEWDFVEAPSQLLEEWAWHPATLKLFARNQAGETIPDELLDKMQRARNFGKGLWVRHQMFYASMSLGYYLNPPDSFDTTGLMRELQERYSPFGYVQDTHMQASFGHLFGYSAMYYTYMWSLVIARDLLSPFEKKGLMDPETATRYRRHILDPGGSQDAAILIRNFLDRDYGYEAFSRWVRAR